jgi:chromosome segregation ATPase
MPPKVEYLTIDTLKLIWENDFLPSIKNEFQSQLESVRGEIKTLSKKCIDIEKSQNFMSREFENFKESLQTTKKHATKAVQSIKKLEVRLEAAEKAIYDQQVLTDSLQQ